MSFRIGECSSCGANYKLPASFQADLARCKNCGGVVHIGKAGEPGPTKAAAPPVPARKPPGASPSSGPVEVTRHRKKRDGPSTKERLMSERKQAEQKAASEQEPAAKSGARTAGDQDRSTRSGSSQRSSNRGKKSGESEVRRARSRGAKGGSAHGRTTDDGEQKDSSRTSRGRRSAPPKKAPVGAIIAAVALVIGVIGGGYWYTTLDDSETAVEATDNTSAVAQNDTETEPTTAADEEITADETSDETGDGEDPGGAEEDAAGTAAEEPKKVQKKPAPPGDPDSVDLTAIADFGPIAGCDEARFIELQELAAIMVDPEAGAAGNRARNKLVEAGKEAFPAIFNAMKSLDLTIEDDFRSADVCQKALQDLCNGSNFGWKYPSQEPDKFHFYDKKVIVSWSKAWEQAKDSDIAWARLAKLDKVPTRNDEAEEVSEETEDALDDLDDL